MIDVTTSASTIATILMGSSRSSQRGTAGERSAFRHAEHAVRLTLDNGGRLIRTADGTFAALFHDPADAVNVMLAVHRVLEDDDEDASPASILILHSGPVDPARELETSPLLQEGRTLLEKGYSGQVLLSDTVLSRVLGNLPAKFSVQELERLSMDHSEGPRQVFQLVATEQADAGSLPPPRRDDDALVHLPYVGRERELAALRDSLQRALHGEGQVVLIAGDPGVGKSRTAEIICSEARDLGASTLWGNVFDWDGAPAYWPWTQILGAVLRDAGSDAVRDLSSDQVTLLSQIVPEIAGGAPTDDDSAPEHSSFRFYRTLTAIGALLRASATQRPLVIVLDDIHWADTASLQVLRFAAQTIRNAPILLIATYRDVELDRTHMISQVLADLHRAPHCRRIWLKGLSRPLVERFVTLATGTTHDGALINSLCDETEGNPFFLTEVVRSMLEDAGTGESHERSLDTGVPESVRTAVQERIRRLSPDSVELLTAASVIGREIDVYLLQQVSGVPVSGLLDILDEPAIRHLIALDASSPTRVRFSHSLVKDALYEATSPADRARLHLAVAEAIESGAQSEQSASALAHHFHAALPLADPAAVLKYAERAGHTAMRQFAWGEAATQFQRALSMLQYVEDVPIERRCDLLLALGEAWNRSGPGSGDVPEARERFLEAFELARELGDGERMAHGALGYAGLNIVAAFGGSRQTSMLQEALDALEPGDHPLRIRILARLSVDLWHRSPESLEHSRTLADQAVEMAHRLNDDTLTGYALWARHAGGFRPDNLDERIADSRMLARLADRTGDPTIATWGCLAQVCDYVEIGELSAAEDAMQWLRRYDQRVSSPFVAHRVSAFSAAILLMQGHYLDAMQEIDRASQLWQSSEPEQHQVQPFILWRDLGQPSRLPREIRLPNELHPWRQAARAHRMALALERGELETARADYESLVNRNLAGIPWNRHWLVTMAMIADAAVFFDDRDLAATLVPMLTPYSDRIMFDGPIFIGHGPVSLYLGRLSATLHQWDAALEWLAHARTWSERLGLQPYAARSLLAHAETLITRQDSGDLSEATGLLEQSVTLARDIGMEGLVTRGRMVMESLQHKDEHPFGLTRREREVLRLVAQGLTDADVAERLYLSPRTVSTHLTSIYTKLNVASRTAAARVAAEYDIV